MSQTSLDLYQAILKLAPNLSQSQTYTSDDLVSEAFLKASSMQLTANDLDQLKKLVKGLAFSRDRVKYPRHSTAKYTAEELADYCHAMLVPEVTVETQPPSLWDYLRAALDTLD
jgi:hypothetical protein